VSEFATSGSTNPQSFMNRPADQVAFVVDDLREAAQRMGRQLGITRWLAWDYTTDYLPNRTYMGQESPYRSLVAMPAFGPQVEIVQPVDGPSIYTKALADKGPSMHHLGYYVPSLDEARAYFGGQGLEPVMTGGGHGVDGDGEFAFWDFTDSYGYYLELAVAPARRYAPHFEIEVER
jgi:methylmalonyl-CoA/ethylmalonyl-CoA epimerase